jgi:amino acid adenylation domain-containing protein
MISVLLNQTIVRGSQKTPRAPAILTENSQLTYLELWQQASAVATVLRQQGVHPGDRIALYFPRDIEAIVAVYGVLLAGGVYVPLDHRSPASRLHSILHDADCAAMLTSSVMSIRAAELLNQCQRYLPLITLPLTASNTIVENNLSEAAPQSSCQTQTAAILYTSGSTGNPRGVVLTHAGLHHFAQWTSEYFELDSRDRLGCIAPLQFDLSTFDIFAVHMAGACMLVPGERTILFPRATTQFFSKHQVTGCYSVPTFWMQLLERGGLAAGQLPHLRHVMFAGEVFPLPQLRQLMQALPQARLTNLFGPLETNVCCLYTLPGIPEEQASEIPVGTACPDTKLNVIDEQGTPVRPGETGELVVTGPSVTPGYWRDTESTKAKRWHGASDSFRTGDLVQQNSAGQLLFRGRRDHQIKLRGFRIELHEIEQVLQRHPNVRQAVALLHRSPSGEPQIVALAAVKTQPTASDDLHQFAAEFLAPYARPARILICEDLPLTITGKIDRQRLLEFLQHEGTD